MVVECVRLVCGLFHAVMNEGDEAAATSPIAFFVVKPHDL